MNIQAWFLLGSAGLISLQSKGFSSFSPESQFKDINSSSLNVLYGPTFTLYMTTGKITTLTIQNFVHKVMSLLINTLCRFVIVFLPRSKCFWISWLQSQSAVISEPKKTKSVTVSTFFSCIYHKVMGPVAFFFFFFFLMLSFELSFSFSFFTFIRRLLISSLLSAIRVVSSAYLRLLIFLPAISIQLGIHSSWHFTWRALHRS